MIIPKWTELGDRDRRMLIELAASYGIDMNGDKVDNMVLPSQDEALSIALEMYSVSRNIIFEKNLKEPA